MGSKTDRAIDALPVTVPECAPTLFLSLMKHALDGVNAYRNMSHVVRTPELTSAYLCRDPESEGRKTAEQSGGTVN